MKITIGCNLLTEVKSVVYPSHMQFWCNVARNFSDKDVWFFAPRRMSIDRMRNEAAKLALETESDFLFFYDDDVMFLPDTLNILIESMKREKALVMGGLTMIRSYPFRPMLFKYTRKDTASVYHMIGYDDYKEHVKEDGILNCDALGFSCVLIDTSILKKLEPPYFVTGPQNTEDVYFCHKVNTQHEMGRIFVNTRAVTGHVLDHYFVTPNNVEHLKRLEKGLDHWNKQLLENAEGRVDRDALYRERVLENLRKQSVEL